MASIQQIKAFPASCLVMEILLYPAHRCRLAPSTAVPSTHSASLPCVLWEGLSLPNVFSAYIMRVTPHLDLNLPHLPWPQWLEPHTYFYPSWERKGLYTLSTWLKRVFKIRYFISNDRQQRETWNPVRGKILLMKNLFRMFGNQSALMLIEHNEHT